ncbi:L,D-transpeptidase [Mycolicibacterium frederiksbergense]|uniref:L,D-transpeptidase n=1 Tax=Mycolicibacterium frederiksbergense TaxID=117567 RepID=UPI0021F2B0BE|nr:L,D-transpeptidase family protein [Mycolicibacterium frederiksbergense]
MSATLGVVAIIAFNATLVTGPGANAQPVGPDSPDPVTPTLTGAPVLDMTTAANQSAPPIPPMQSPDPSAIPTPVASGSPVGQNPTPYSGPPVFAPPTFNPLNGSMVGVAKPIIINFQRTIADRPMAEQAIHIASNPPVPGKFYWMSDTQVRWRPFDFWPANTTVSIDASGTKSSFRTGESLVATIDDSTHQMTVTRNGIAERTFPVSLGKPNYETPNGTYYVLEKFADLVMDSSTYGVPIDSPEGYKLKVQDAVRIDNSGIFVHSAPWSVSDQGRRNVSHGCPNLSPANAQWFYDNFGSGDPVVIKNTTGGLYNQNDGAQDWQI